MKLFRLLPVVAICALLLSSCESDTFLKSKKKLDSDLQGYWSPVYGTSQYGTAANNDKVLWNFKDGEVFIIKTNDAGSDVAVDNGRYSLKTKLDEVFLTIEGLNSPQYNSGYGFNIKWNLVDLSSGSLDIAGEPHNGGRIEIEFSKTTH